MSKGFAAALSGEEEIQIEFAKSDGRTRRILVWFTVEGGNLELLPVNGTKTKWLIDVERSGRMKVSVRGVTMPAIPTVVREKEAVERIRRRFAEKYGEDDVRRYYPTSDVALTIPL